MCCLLLVVAWHVVFFFLVNIIIFVLLFFIQLKIADPYRWLEDPDSEETKEYVKQQNKVAQPYLEDCPEWKKINEKLTTLWNYPKYNVPIRKGDFYFSYMNTGLQNQK